MHDNIRCEDQQHRMCICTDTYMYIHTHVCIYTCMQTQHSIWRPNTPHVLRTHAATNYEHVKSCFRQRAGENHDKS